MSTKKQRRRREKLQRHEYEYVVETEEGEQVVESPHAAASAERKAPPPKLVDRRGREIKPPSWRRVLRRGAIFAPIMLVLLFLTGGSLSTGQKIVQLAFLLAIFLPFSYFVDAMIYRSAQKRARRDAGR